MQKRLFIDSFDGSVPSKTIGQHILYHTWKLYEGKTVIGFADKGHPRIGIHQEIDIEAYIDNMPVPDCVKDDDDAELLYGPLTRIHEDPIRVSHAHTIPIYRRIGQNFLFSKPLTQTLSITRANVTVDILPEKEFCYYMEMPDLFDTDGSRIEGILVTKFNFPNGYRILDILLYTPFDVTNHEAYLDHWLANKGPLAERATRPTIDPVKFKKLRDHKTIEIKDLCIPYSLEDNEKLEDALVRAVHDYNLRQATDPAISCFRKESAAEILASNSYKTIINGLLYILSGEENLEVQKNPFSKKKSKYEAQSKIYTPKEFVALGKNVKFLREYVEDGYYWAPFFRKKQGATDGRKTVYVRGHFKYFKNKKGEDCGKMD